MRPQALHLHLAEPQPTIASSTLRRLTSEQDDWAIGAPGVAGPHRTAIAAYFGSPVRRAACPRTGQPMNTESLISLWNGMDSFGVPSAANPRFAAASKRSR